MFSCRVSGGWVGGAVLARGEEERKERDRETEREREFRFGFPKTVAVPLI